MSWKMLERRFTVLIMAINKKIKELMNIKGINQRDLSKLSGITESTLSRYLNGSRLLREEKIVKIAKALTVNPSYFFEEDGDKNDPYTEISTVIARCKDKLTVEEKNKLIYLLAK